jgi:small ligand-binding sensory domain FIST
VHADGHTHDLPELLAEMSERTATGYLFGGLASSRTRSCHMADGRVEGGLSGVAFTRDVGARLARHPGLPAGRAGARRITACERNVVTELDGRPALRCLLADLDLTLDDSRRAMPQLRATLVGPVGRHARAAARPRRHRAFGDDVRVRHLIGLDPARHGVAVADLVEPGMRWRSASATWPAARRDLVRICAEIRDELAPEPADRGRRPRRRRPLRRPTRTARIAGAVYVSCAGRGGPHFGAPSAELQIVRHARAARATCRWWASSPAARSRADHLYGYTGVLTVFTPVSRLGLRCARSCSGKVPCAVSVSGTAKAMSANRSACNPSILISTA